MTLFRHLMDWKKTLYHLIKFLDRIISASVSSPTNFNIIYNQSLMKGSKNIKQIRLGNITPTQKNR